MADYSLYRGAYNGPQVDAAIGRALAGGALDQEIASVRAAVGSPLTAATVAAMTDISRVYVYTGTEAGYVAGNWYYWSGSAWTSGGVYNAVAVDDQLSDTSENAVQNKVVKEAIDEVAADVASDHAYAVASFPHTSVSGASVSFADGADNVPVSSLVVTIDPVQSGSGTPSTDNIRPISSWLGLTLTQVGADPTDPTTIPISWQTEAGYIFQGTLDVLTGVLTVTHWGKSFVGNDIVGVSGSGLSAYYQTGTANKIVTSGQPEERIPYSSHYRVGADPDDPTAPYITYATNGTVIYFSYVNMVDGAVDLDAFKAYLDAQAASNTPVQLVWVLAVPKVFQIDPKEVKTMLGENTISTDVGTLALDYRQDPTLVLATKAPLESPALTGTPTAPTAAAGTNNTQIATTAFVAAAISAAIDDAIGGEY